MKPLRSTRIALLATSLIIGGLALSRADDGAAPSGDHHDSVLTADEHAELKKDRDQVFASNPDLKTEEESLRDQRKSMKDASEDDKKAFHEKWHAYHDKLNTAIEAIDPNAAALIAKVEAAHHHHDGN